MKHIRFNVDDDLGAVIAEITKLRDSVKEIPGKFADEYSASVQSRFDTFDDPNKRPIAVTTQKLGTTKAQIVATGEDVVFAEYGTGYAAETDEGILGVTPPTPTGPGTWSANEGSKVFVNHEHWHYKKTNYGVTVPFPGPTRAVRDTVLDIERDVVKKAEEYIE